MERAVTDTMTDAELIEEAWNLFYEGLADCVEDGPIMPDGQVAHFVVRAGRVGLEGNAYGQRCAYVFESESAADQWVQECSAGLTA